ncbi:MAG TPA: RNA methyltransferase [Vicinamibacterales bacterium]|nr:RNA methyltransferase [Vicinamibacterales bacterium]
MERVSSRHNPLVREFRALARSGGRDGRVLLDGEHLLTEALASGVDVEVAAALDGALPERIVQDLRSHGTRVIIIAPAVLAAVSPVRQPSGVVAIARLRSTALSGVMERPPQLVLLLAGVQDPGNVGAIVRAAEACGATGVVCTAGSADPFGWKALRGSMGSALRVPIASKASADAALETARAYGLALVAAVPRGGTPLPVCDLRPPAMILLGGEGPGLTGAALRAADARVTVPMRAPVESMNVAAVAAIVLYEAARQRAGEGIA